MRSGFSFRLTVRNRSETGPKRYFRKISGVFLDQNWKVNRKSDCFGTNKNENWPKNWYILAKLVQIPNFWTIFDRNLGLIFGIPIIWTSFDRNFWIYLRNVWFSAKFWKIMIITIILETLLQKFRSLEALFCIGICFGLGNWDTTGNRHFLN